MAFLLLLRKTPTMIIRLPGLMASLCFILALLLPFRYAPMPSFYAEALVFTALVFLWLQHTVLFNQKHIEIPYITLPFLGISFIPLLQYTIGKVYFFERAIIPFFYIIAFWSAIIVSYNFIRNKSPNSDYFFRNIAITLIIAGLLSTFISTLQWLNFNFWPLIDKPSGNRFSANLGQPNHLSTILIMSIIGCLYLFESKAIKAASFYFITGILTWGVALTQSRTAWITFPILTILYIIYNNKSKRTVNFKCFSQVLFIYIVIILLMPILNKLLNDLGISVIKTSTVAERASGGYLRFIIWDQMIHAITQKPLLGWGWYQTSVAQYHVLPLVPGTEWINSSHAFILDILVWCGLPLGCILIFWIAYFYTKIINFKIFTNLFALMMITPVIIHSFLEFPLFYSYFLIPCGLCTGLLINKSDLKRVSIPYIFSLLISIIGGILVYWVFMDYNAATNNQRLADHFELTGRKEKVILQPNLFFDLQRNNAEFTLWETKNRISADQLREFEKVVGSGFNVYAIYKYAMILALNDQQAQAQALLNMINNRFSTKLTYAELLQNAKK